MITAQQAKQLFEKKKTRISVADVSYSIECMAEAGYRYAGFEKQKLLDIEQVKEWAINAGFVIEESELYIIIKW